MGLCRRLRRHGLGGLVNGIGQKHGVGSVAQVVLQTLTLDDTELVQGEASTINILGTRAGSTLSIATGALPTGMTLNSAARTITGTPATIETADFSLSETLAGATNTPNTTAGLSVGVIAAPDVTAPVLTNPLDAKNGTAAMTGSVDTDEANGTLYWFISTSATPPSAANLKAAIGAVAAGSQAVSATGTQSISDSGLSAATTYYTHFLHTDAVGNDSAIATASGFTTDSVANPTVTLSGNIQQAEGDSGTVTYTYTVTRSATAGLAEVIWAFSAGDTSADDFSGAAYPTGGVVALADGVASGTFSVVTTGDTDVEGSETFTVSIAAPSGYDPGANMSATGTILNDDAAAGMPTPTFTNTAAAGEAPKGTLSFGPGLYPGDYLVIDRSADGVTGGDPADANLYTTPTLRVFHYITDQQWQAGEILPVEMTGYSNPSGTYYQQYFFARPTGIVVGGVEQYDYSAPSNELNDTITTSVAEFATTDGVNRGIHVGTSDVSGGTTGPILRTFGEGNTGDQQYARALPEAQNDKFHFEITVVAFDTASTANPLGIADAAQSLASYVDPGSGSGQKGCHFRLNTGTKFARVTAYRSGGGLSVDASQDIVAGDTIVVECELTRDGSNNVTAMQVWLWVHLVDTGGGVPADELLHNFTITDPAWLPQNPTVISGHTSAAGISEANFGGSPFVKTPTAGFDIYA